MNNATTDTAAETTKAVKGFRTTAKAVERKIAELRNGRVDAMSVYRAVERLEDRASKPEIRGDETAREECWSVAAELRRAVAPAADAGRDVVRMRREVAADKLAPAPRHEDAALKAYRLELALARLHLGDRIDS